MIKDIFPFYEEKKQNSYQLFGKQNNKQHCEIFTHFTTEMRGEFKAIINHFLNKLQVKQDAQQIIKQNLASFYICKNQQGVEVYCIDQQLQNEPKFKTDISDETAQQFYLILLSLSNINIQSKATEQITAQNYLRKIEQLYLELAQNFQQQQKKGNTDQQYNVIKIKCTNTLLLRPNGNIINLPQISNDIFNYNQVNIHIQRNPLFNPVSNQVGDQILQYIGQIEQQYYYPHGYGILNSEQNFEFQGKFEDGLATGNCKIEFKMLQQQFQGQFKYGERHGESELLYKNGVIVKGCYSNDKKQGVFQTIKNKKVAQEQIYENDQIVKKSNFKFDENLQTSRYLLIHKNIPINNHLFNGLKEGQWINQLCIDYYLELAVDYYNSYYNTQIQLFNTVDCQDIFTSQISKINETNINFQGKVKEIIMNCNNYNKLVFIINADQAHFLVIIYQKNCLYVLNSFSSNQDLELLKRFSLMFQSSPQLKQIQVEQQKNCYDCGLHSIYNVLQQYKYYNKNVEDIDYKISIKYIKQLRMHLKRVLINDYEHIIQKQQD